MLTSFMAASCLYCWNVISSFFFYFFLFEENEADDEIDLVSNRNVSKSFGRKSMDDSKRPHKKYFCNRWFRFREFHVLERFTRTRWRCCSDHLMRIKSYEWAKWAKKENPKTKDHPYTHPFPQRINSDSIKLFEQENALLRIHEYTSFWKLSRITL